MASWASSKTAALKNVEKSLKAVDGVLSYMSDTPGKPLASERALYAAAVVFIYGIWENYCEQLAIELGSKIAYGASPEDVPSKTRKSLEKNSAWELAVHPGWRQLWINKVTTTAIGDEGEKFGLNTAKSGQVAYLFEIAGMNGVLGDLDSSMVPDHLTPVSNDASEAVNKLVELRGEIVHTGAVPDSLRKQHVLEWRKFLEDITEELDRKCRKKCKELL